MKKPRFIASIVLIFTLAGVRAADLTFFTCSDTHYREDASSNDKKTAIIEMMNTLPGKKYPEAIDGGTVGTPCGVIVPGDLVDTGQGPPKLVNKQWALWKADFGLTGKDGKLKFPVYEGYGNHDLNGNLLIENYIKERTLLRSKVLAISDNGFHYAWQWDGVHFVEVNLYPGNKRPKGQQPREALDFLRDELKKNVADSRQPVVVVQHYQPTDTWWTDEEKEAFYDVIKNYNVILIIHGHQGHASITDWKGITTVDNNDFLGTGFFVFHITDRKITVAQCTPSGEWGKCLLKKDIEFPATRTRQLKK